MELTHMKIENFRSLKKANFSLKENVYVLTGKNNSGKGNLIRGISFLSESLRRGDFKGYLQDFTRAISRGNLKLSLKYELFFLLAEDEIAEFISGLPIKDVKKNEIRRNLAREIQYRVEMNHLGIAEESIVLRLDDKEITYAKGSWLEGIYVYEIMRSESLVPKFPRVADFRMRTLGGGTPPTSIMFKAGGNPKGLAEELPLRMIHEHLTSICMISAVRNFPENGTVCGGIELKSNGENLSEVFHSLISSDRGLAGDVIESVGKIFAEVADINAPITEGGTETYVAVAESSAEDVHYPWDLLSAGLRNIIFQIVYLSLNRNCTLLLLEEPEANLHVEAAGKFVEILKQWIRDTKIKTIITTHSPAVMDAFDMRNIVYAAREKGDTRLISMIRNQNMEELMKEAGMTKGEFFGSQPPRYVLIFERRKDGRIFRKFLAKKRIDPVKERIGIVIPSRKRGGGLGLEKSLTGDWGSEQAIKFARLMKLTQMSAPFRIIMGSDTLGGDRRKRMEEEGFDLGEYSFLSKRSMGDYLLDAKAMGKAVGKEMREMEKALSLTPGTWEEKLIKILGDGYVEASDDMMGLIVKHLDATPEDIAAIIEAVVNS